jgi:hypothetical protein
VRVVEGNAGKFFHLLVFQCQRCGNPIAIPQRDDAASLELVGAMTFSICRTCGWSEWLEGMRAQNHWVEPWPDASETLRFAPPRMAESSKADGVSLPRNSV